MKFRKALGIVLVLGIGAMAIAASQAKTVGSTHADYDGRALFRGLLLASGPVAQELPQIRDAELVRPAELAMIESSILGRIAGADQTFFDRFESEIESGDHARVRSAYLEGARQLETALRAEMQGSHSQAAALLASTTSRSDAGIAFVVAAVAVVVWKWFWTMNGQDGQDARLWTDQLIDSIATRLAA